MEYSDSNPTDFFKKWSQSLDDLRHEMRSVRSNVWDEGKIQSLIDKTVSHYDTFYKVRSDRSDPILAFTTPWATCIERGVVFWLAGWRPNIIIHLLYTESSRFFEKQLPDILLGAGSGDLGDLSPAQLTVVDELQRRTIKEEDTIDGEIRRIQEEMLSRFLESELDLADVTSRVRQMISLADDLRMRTLRSAIGMLRPMQAMDLLIGIADFEIGLRKFGRKQDKVDWEM